MGAAMAGMDEVGVGVLYLGLKFQDWVWRKTEHCTWPHKRWDSSYSG
jgi:hypothetical protein